MLNCVSCRQVSAYGVVHRKDRNLQAISNACLISWCPQQQQYLYLAVLNVNSLIFM